ncbi:pogo transposable element with KRAB domain [Rhizophagus clarus]|uniref:Pogo transposable element with KRAB domain n=1 Tax=Rhizophagus clarus TaxID=94130 RepID=A0A8H3M9S6_9GLOM|nr:pogo transposable element with KRAB domain [Rhizophagus clarus]
MGTPVAKGGDGSKNQIRDFMIITVFCVVKKTKYRQVRQATKHSQTTLAVKRSQVKQATKHGQAKLAAKYIQKKKVVAYAKSNGRNEAARHFQLNGSMVSHWVKASKTWIAEMKRHTMRRKQELAVTYTTVKITMFDILNEPEMTVLYGNTTENFKALFYWLTLFMKSNIFNMDKTPVWFDMMDANLMKDYVDYLVEEVDETEFPKMMVYDSFKGHLEESVKNKFRENNFDLVVIPGGLTSICQPLDVSINKPFKDNLQNDNIDEIGDEESEEFVIEMDKNLIDAEARFEAITLEDDPLFKIELNFSNFSVHNSEFVDFDESDWK